jgi:hypothetical protein
MRNVQAYYQHPNFEVERLGRVTLEETLELLDDFPPEDDMTLYVTHAGKVGLAPPLLGLEDEDNCALTIAAFAPGDFELTVLTAEVRRVLGLLPVRSEREQRVGISDRYDLAAAVQLFAQGDLEALRQLAG